MAKASTDLDQAMKDYNNPYDRLAARISSSMRGKRTSGDDAERDVIESQKEHFVQDAQIVVEKNAI